MESITDALFYKYTNGGRLTKNFIHSKLNYSSLVFMELKFDQWLDSSVLASISLTSCTNSKAIGWSHKHVYCCFTNMCSRFEFVVSHKQQYQGKLQLFATDRMDFCLGGSPNQKLTSKELKSGAFAPCRWHTNQVFFFPPIYHEWEMFQTK